jgi:hypothetical protein
MDGFIGSKKPDRTETKKARSMDQLRRPLRSKGTPNLRVEKETKAKEARSPQHRGETMGAEEVEDNNREETIDRACGRSYDGVRKSAAGSRTVSALVASMDAQTHNSSPTVLSLFATRSRREYEQNSASIDGQEAQPI